MKKTTPRLKQPKGLSITGIVSLAILVLIILGAIFAPYITKYDPMYQDETCMYHTPSWQHLFGTDRFGRDIFCRVLYGSRVSLLMGMLSVGIAGIVGLIIGVSAGFYGGFLDTAVMRLMDAISVIPYILVVVLVAAANGFKARGSTIAIGISLIPDFAIWSRALVLNLYGKGFLEAERAFGIKKAVILFRHVLPNIISQYIMKFTNAFSEAVLAVTALGYLGYAVQPPSPEWGNMLAEGYNSILGGRWWLTIFPGLCILVTVVCVNLLGNDLSRIINGHTNRQGGKG